MVLCYDLWQVLNLFFFVKQKTAYEMRISDWSSDVCSSDLFVAAAPAAATWLACDRATALKFLRPKKFNIDRAFEVVEGYVVRKIGRASCRERVCQYV